MAIFNKGSYNPINNSFLKEGMNVLQKVAIVQKKYNKPDTDTFINELRDSITGYYLGFDMVNTEKHGFDCKHSKDGNIFLEVKSASFSAKSWQATFNDTTLEKAEAFKDEKLWLALSVWENACELLFIVYGQNDKIGCFLEEKVNHFKAGNTVRSTQSISVKDLVVKYGFKILCVNKTKTEVENLLFIQNKTLKNLDDSVFVELKNFKNIIK